MFLFSWCTSHQSQYLYEIRQDYKKINNTNSATNLIQKINESEQYVIKVKRSKLQNTSKLNSKQKTKDLEFPPTKQSLGDISNLSTCNWKRLSEIVHLPTLFTTSKMKVTKTSKTSLTGDYFLSALSAIVQEPKRIKDMFVTQQISSNGIYSIRLRVNGQIQEVVVDDFVPVNQLGQPLFVAPSHSEIWIPLLQKAWAKVNKSYANILSGNSAQVFKALNYAPSEVHYIEDKQQNKQKLWKMINEAAQRKSPVSCLTSHSNSIDWIHINLIPNYHYTLILSFMWEKYCIQIKNHIAWQNSKMRTPKLIGRGKDQLMIHSFGQKIKLLEHFNQKQGEFIMLYNDFVKFFSQIYISYQLKQGNFIWEEIFSNPKNGSFWQVDITHEGLYSFQLHQQSLRNISQQNQSLQYGRSTIVLAKINEPKNYEYICGAMRLVEEDILVNSFLKQGKYIIYTKIQAKNNMLIENNKSSLSCYSNKLCRFRLIEKKNCQNFFQNMFLNFARQNKRQEYNRQKMWLSWRLLFKECGFAYIAFGNAKDSDKKFSIKFQSKNFESMHFKLKSPFKAKKGQQNTVFEFNVLPGQQKIILARVINDNVVTLKFPPPIQMKIEELIPDKS